MKILSNREDPQICRPGAIASVIIDTDANRAHIAYGQSTPQKYTMYSLKQLKP